MVWHSLPKLPVGKQPAGIVARMPLHVRISGLSWTYWALTTVRVMQEQTHLSFHTKWESMTTTEKGGLKEAVSTTGELLEALRVAPQLISLCPSQLGVSTTCSSPRMRKYIMNACKHDMGCACTGGRNGGRKIRSWKVIPRRDELMPSWKATRVMWKSKSLHN